MCFMQRIIEIMSMQLKLFAQSGVSVQHIPFDERKVDFSGDGKLNLN